LTSIRRRLSIAQTALFSKRIKKKVVVFESDDWGSIRTPLDIGDEFKSFNLNLHKNPYHRFDTLESPTDIDNLLTTIENLSSAVGRKVKITLNYVLANPDFDKIKTSNYTQYFYESFPTTYDRYYGSTVGLDYVLKATENQLSLPQFHGREHVHAPYWLEKLRSGDKVLSKAFDLGFWGLGSDVYNLPGPKLQATFDARNESDLNFAHNSITEGVMLHKDLFGFKPKSFIPNNYTWPTTLDGVLLDNGIEFLQGMKKMANVNLNKEEKRSYALRRAGYKTKSGLINIVRNSSFEPSFYRDREKEIAKCLSEIRTAFFCKQPAVISTHRINYVGGLSEQNRIQNLKLFSRLVKTIVKEWPEVEFWNSVDLGENYRKI